VADEPSPSPREVGMSDEKKDTRDDKDVDVEAHKFMTEEPGEDESGKTKARFKTKTKTLTSDEIDDDLGDRAKY
jgi:hypothetical protein